MRVSQYFRRKARPTEVVFHPRNEEDLNRIENAWIALLIDGPFGPLFGAFSKASAEERDGDLIWRIKGLPERKQNKIIKEVEQISVPHEIVMEV